MPQFLVSTLIYLFLILSVRAETELAIAGSQFTINGKPTFLLGISYYAGLGASKELLETDLDNIRRDGFNWLRVWADWAALDNDISAVQTNGAPREPFLSRLESLLAICDKRGLVVDVTLAREKGGRVTDRLVTLKDHVRAVETLLNRLRPYRNWYLDLGNERNIKDGRFVSWDELKALRDKAKTLDPKRLITASHSSDDADFQNHLENYLKTVQVDFVSVHRPRHKQAAIETENATRLFLAKMRELGILVPIHYQEPFRRGYQDWQPTRQDFYQDLRGAIKGGAAGWCFHNGSQRTAPESEPRRSFDLRKKALYDQFDETEREVVKRPHKIVLEEAAAL